MNINEYKLIYYFCIHLAIKYTIQLSFYAGQVILLVVFTDETKKITVTDAHGFWEISNTQCKTPLFSLHKFSESGPNTHTFC